MALVLALVPSGVAGEAFDRHAPDVYWKVSPLPRTRWQPPPCITCAEVRSAQIALVALGFGPGPIDGVMGPRTRAAIRAFEARHGLPVTGRLSATLIERLTAEASR